MHFYEVYRILKINITIWLYIVIKQILFHFWCVHVWIPFIPIYNKSYRTFHLFFVSWTYFDTFSSNQKDARLIDCTFWSAFHTVFTCSDTLMELLIGLNHLVGCFIRNERKSEFINYNASIRTCLTYLWHKTLL